MRVGVHCRGRDETPLWPEALERSLSYALIALQVSDRPSVANSMKLAVNYAAASIIEIIGEIYAFAEKSGIDISQVQQFFEMAFAHPALKFYAEKARGSTRTWMLPGTLAVL